MTGACYIVGDNPGGDWAGHAAHLAGWTQAGWRFIAPVPGMTVHVISTGTTALYRNGVWEIGGLSGASLSIDGTQVVGAQAAAIADPAGGATVDSEARAALVSILSALRQHGLIAT